MTARYRTRPQVKFKAFRELERRRVQASDTVWAVLVGSKLAASTMASEPNQKALLADQYPDIPHVERMNQRLDRASALLHAAEAEVCTMALNYTFGLHEEFLRACLRFLAPQGLITLARVEKLNAVELHETIERKTGSTVDPDALALFHLTRHIRNAHTHAAGFVRETLVDYFARLTSDQRALWESVTSEPFRVPTVGDSATVGVNGLVGSLAIQKRLAYDVNLALQNVVTRSRWADIAAEEYFAESGKSLKYPTAVRSLRGYARPTFGVLKLTDDELSAAIERRR
ncbi:hypothetical protein PP359_13345 [Sphingomonas sp. BLCC-B65]|nr:hypothetical protein [Sphingomonas sp. BLCC-B65]